MTALREEFKEGEQAILDENYLNSSIVTVVCQSEGKMFTRVKLGTEEWDVMTRRLTKLNEQTL